MLAKLIGQIPVAGLLALAIFEYWRAFHAPTSDGLALGFCIMYIVLAVMAELIILVA